jgi:hypothetical protein
VLNNVADQLGLIHALGELRFDVIAALDSDTFQIRPHWRIDFSARKVATSGQVGDRGAFDERVKNIPEATAICPAWCRGQPQNDRIRVGLDEPHICASAHVMCLVEDQQVGRR